MAKRIAVSSIHVFNGAQLRIIKIVGLDLSGQKFIEVELFRLTAIFRIVRDVFRRKTLVHDAKEHNHL